MLAHVGAKCTLHAERGKSVGELRQNVLELKWKPSRVLSESTETNVVPQPHSAANDEATAAAEQRFF